MSRKNWIAFLLSCIIALVYALPWLAFSDQARTTEIHNGPAGLRILYLFVTVFVTCAIFFCCNFFLKNFLSGQRRAVRIAVQILIHAIITLLCTSVLLIIATLIFDVKAVRAYLVFYLIRNLILAVVVSLLCYIIDLVERLEKERMEVLLLENRNSESELSALRSQIDPHFIFNTLSTLGSLITPENRRAILFLEHMSDTFRYVMEKRSTKMVSLREELQFLSSYLYMMNCRFGDSIQLTVDIDNQEQHFVPQFALQIAVENAIKHNSISSIAPLLIDIRKNKNYLIVRNSVRKAGSCEGFGIGLSNLSKRYQLLSNTTIEIYYTETHFELSLPLL